MITLYEFGDFEELPLNPEQILNFKKYLGEIWRNRLLWNKFYDNETSHKQAFFNFEGNKVQARNYVGYFQFEDIGIQIFPKIFKSKKVKDEQFIIEHLCYFLSYTQSFNFPFTNIKSGSLPNLTFQDLWFYVLLQFIEKDLEKQAYYSFETLQTVESQVKGQINFREYTQKYIAKANWQKLPLTYQTLELDNIFYQIVKYCIKQICRRSTNQLVQNKAFQVLGLLKNISDKNISYEDVVRVKLNSLFEDKQLILDSCKLWLLNEQASYNQGLNFSFNLLLPMEKVFEEFVFGFIQTHFPDWQAVFQKKGHLAKNDFNKEVFKLYSDIYLSQKNYILDTKYKLRSLPFKNTKSGVLESDLYQMLSYGIGQECQDIFLVYPASFGEENLEQKQSKFTIESQFLNENKITIQAIDLSITDGNVTYLDEKIRTQMLNLFL